MASKENIVSTTLMWEKFSVYLFIDKKMSTGYKSKNALKSRFTKFYEYFKEIEFNRDNFGQFIILLKQKTYSDAYINNFIKIAKDWDKYTKTNCLQDYTYFKEKEKEIDVLTPEEVEKLSMVRLPYGRFREEINLRDYAVIQFLFATGCRIGELESLRWDDVRNAPIPHVIFRDTKNGEDHKVCVSERIYDLILKMPHRGECVFNGMTGKTFGRIRFSKNLKKRADMIGLNKEVYPHIFRHSRGTNLSLSGFSQDEVARFLNHKDINTTSRYIHHNLQDMAPMAYANPLESRETAFSDLLRLAYRAVEKLFDRRKYKVTINVEPILA